MLGAQDHNESVAVPVMRSRVLGATDEMRPCFFFYNRDTKIEGTAIATLIRIGRECRRRCRLRRQSAQFALLYIRIAAVFVKLKLD